MDMEIERLRQRAVAAMGSAPARQPGVPDDMMDALRLVEELRVYQTELEIQNQDLKAAQMQTESAMRRYRRLFENLPMDAMTLDGQGFIVEANAAARSHFSLRANAALQRRSVYQLFAFESRSKLYSVLSHGLDVASATEVQLMAPRDDPSIEVDAHLITVDPASIDSDERLMVLVDRTYERRLAVSHRELQESQRILRASIDALDEAFVLYDPQDRFVFCNERYKAIYATSADLMVPGASFEDMLRAGALRGQYPEAIGQVDAWIAQRMAVHRSGNTTITQKTDSGKTLRILERRTEDGYTVGFRVDITAFTDATEAALAANRHYQSLLDAASEVSIIATDTSGIVQVFNRGAERMLGYTAEEVIGHRRAADFHLQEEVGQRARELSVELGLPISGLSVFTAKPDRDGQEQREWTYRRKNGESISVAMVVTAVRSASNEITGYLGIAQDITQRKQAQANLQLSANVFTWAREGILITDADTRIIQVNVAFTRITGYAEDDVIGRSPSVLKSGRQDQAFYARMWQSIKTVGHWEGEIWNRRKSGEVYAELLSISAVHDAHNKIQNYVGLFTDISSQKAHEQELEHIARYDVLTALPNRALLADRLQQEMAHCLRQRKQLAVVFIDLDGFKQVNDQHGHNIGDEVLIGLAQRMKAALREGDTLSRIGGDEFVAVLTALDHPRDCELVLTRLLEAAAQTMVINGAEIQVSASIGVTLFPQDAGEPDLLMRHADHAMYQAKQAGKNRYHYFDVKDDTDVKTHRETIHQIQSALERGEFVLHYQPKVNLKSGAVMGMEALIRWQHPVRGLLAPGEFLPAIEGHPISLLVGEWVLRTALAQMDQWRQSGLDLPVSVNVGGLQLLHPHFVAILLELLALYPGVAPQNLELEILETSALHDIEEVSRVMHACSKLGVRFALDDFGTGYSSLTYLKRLPAQTLKIDQSFVRDMLGDPDDAAIVEGIIGLTVAFRRSVIAEGVETMGHGAMLLSLGCFQAQGYGVARPMPAQEVAPWIHAWASGERWKALQTLPTIAQAH
jgi:diguanylate cyclase (GGDEF)-like protein/PAS domain S-box-containing protein